MARNENKDRGESDHLYFSKVVEFIEMHRGFFIYITKGSKVDWEDLEQEIKLKFFEKAEKEPKWLDTIENIDSYVLAVARNKFININRREFKSVFIDDWNTTSRRKTDGGDFYRRIERALAYRSGRKKIKNMLEQKFSPYEQAILTLKYIEGCTPRHVAEILLEENLQLLKDEFPKLANLSEEGFKTKIREFVPKDCNRLRSKFRKEINDSFGTDDSEW